MFNAKRQRELALRQGMLLARSSELRGDIARYTHPFQAPLGRVDEARRLLFEAWDWLRAHPEVPIGAAIAVAVIRPRRALRWSWRWGRRAWFGWALYKRLQAKGVIDTFQVAAKFTKR